MRLIDADALHEALMTKQKWVVRCGDKHNEGYTYDQVHFAIDEAPTIEAVSIDDYRSMENTCYKLQKALYDIADRKTENCSEKPNNCECEPRKEQNFCGKCRYLYRDFKYGLSCYRLMDNEPCKYEERKDEPTISKMEQVDEPQKKYPTEWCEECDLWKENNCMGVAQCKANMKALMKIYEASKDEPQTEQVGVPFGEMDETTFKSHYLNCQRDTADIKCLDCDGNKYFLSYVSETDCPWK